MRRTALGLVARERSSLVAPIAQSSVVGPVDPLRFSQLKDFVAGRSSSNNPDRNSNDDSKRPIPGETVTLADLQGPGVVTHIWLTIAANEYGWPRLLRLRVYYDGSAEPSVDAPVGRFLRRRPRRSSGRSSRSWSATAPTAARATATGRCRSASPARSRSPTKGAAASRTSTYHVDWEKAKELPADTAYFHARYRQELPAPADGKPYEFLNVKGRGHLRRHGALGRAGRGRLVRRRRRALLRGRRDEAVHRGDRQRRTTSTTPGACTSRTGRTRACPSPRERASGRG